MNIFEHASKIFLIYTIKQPKFFWKFSNNIIIIINLTPLKLLRYFYSSKESFYVKSI